MDHHDSRDILGEVTAYHQPIIIISPPHHTDVFEIDCIEVGAAAWHPESDISLNRLPLCASDLRANNLNCKWACTLPETNLQ